MKQERWLVISDLQVPFEASGALDFCVRLAKDFRIDQDHVLCVGDEVDQYFGSAFAKDPDQKISAREEIEETLARLNRWYRYFPKVKVAISNHGLRWAKRAFDAQIPSDLIRPYQEVIRAPKGWQWRHEWVIKARHPFRMIHGMGYSGMNGHRTAAIDSGISTLIGHLHSHGGVSHVNNGSRPLWGMNVGCLIDPESFAFAYGRYSRAKPTRGVGVVVDSGKTPIFVPYDEVAR
jgi:hypothetical protein